MELIHGGAEIWEKKLPVGLDNFEKIIRQDFYYVDKTGLIEDLLESWGEVNLFTRPRRFGKSLNMSMLKSFFEIGCDSSLFDGLKIRKNTGLCDRYMGRFPVVSISLKGVDGRTFESACTALKGIIGTEAMRFQFLEESEVLSQKEKELYRQLIQIDRNNYEVYAMSEGILLGLFGYREDWIVKSNVGSGIGYSDILIEVPEKRIGMILEIKYAQDGGMEAACASALKQIEEKQYTARLKEDGMRTILQYGIACFRKDCRVKVL